MIVARGLGIDTENYGVIVTNGYGLNHVPVITTGGALLQRRYGLLERERLREEEELILLMAGELWLN